MHQLIRTLSKRACRSGLLSYDGGTFFLNRVVPGPCSRSFASAPRWQCAEGRELFRSGNTLLPFKSNVHRAAACDHPSLLSDNIRGAAVIHSGAHPREHSAVRETSTSDWDVGQPSAGERTREGQTVHGHETPLQDRAGETAPHESQPSPDAELGSREAAVGAAGIQTEESAGTGTPGPAAFGDHHTQEGDDFEAAREFRARDNANPRTKRENLGAIRQERVTSDSEVLRSRARPQDPAHGSRLGGDDSDYPPTPPKPEEGIRSHEMPRMVLDSEGTSVWVLGTRVTVKVTGEETGGEYALLEYHLSPGDGAESHTHAKEDETWYMLEGEMEWKVGGSPFKATKGSYLHLPKGIPHSYHNRSTTPAHMLVHCMPAGLEKYFLEIGRPASADASAKRPPNNEEDAARASEAGVKYGVSYHPADVASSEMSS